MMFSKINMYRKIKRIIQPLFIREIHKDSFYLVYNGQLKTWLIIPKNRTYIYYYGHEENIVNLIKKIVKSFNREPVFFDIGAFIGFYSVLASKLGCKVYSFEPDPRSWTLLNLNLRINKLEHHDINIFNVAVGDRTGYIILQLANVFSESSATNYLDKNKIVKRIKVPVITIDDFITKRKIKRVDIIKIDVEGYGANVINGALNAISEFRPHIIFEIHRFGQDSEFKTMILLRNKFDYKIKLIEYRNEKNFIVYLYQ